MLPILLLILKIIGIILLVLLALVVLLVLLVLFVPVRYQLTGYRKTGTEAPVYVKIRISWLLRLVRVLFSYPEAAYVKVKILFLTVFSSAQTGKPESGEGKREKKGSAERDKDKKAEESGSKKEKDRSKKAGHSGFEKAHRKETEGRGVEYIKLVIPDGKVHEAAGGTGDSEVSDIGIGVSEADRVSEAGQKDVKDGERAETGPAQAENDVPNEETPGKTSFFTKILDRIKNIRYTIKEIYVKIKDAVKNIRYYIEIIQSDEFRKALSLCSGQLLRILRSIRPTRFKASLTVGMKDPGTTGQILEVYSILYPVIGNNVFITPDFEQEILEGDVNIKGRISVRVLLLAAWRIYRDRNIRKLIRMLKREAA